MVNKNAQVSVPAPATAHSEAKPPTGILQFIKRRWAFLVLSIIITGITIFWDDILKFFGVNIPWSISKIIVIILSILAFFFGLWWIDKRTTYVQ